jgi:hypothetical protein
MQFKKCLLLSFFLFSSFVFFTVTAYAGWVMEETDGTTTYLGEGMIKAEYNNEGLNFAHIINANKGLITMVDKNRKIYGSGTPDEYCNATKSFAKDMQDQMLAGLPPEQRKMMEEQMKQFQQMPKSAPMENMPKPVVSIKKTGSSDVIAGHKTDKYTVNVDGDKYQDIWIASDISMDDEMKKLGLDKFNLITKRMDKCMESSEGDIGMMADPLESPEYKKLSEKGFVMREVYYTGGFSGPGGDEKTEVVRLEKKSISAPDFKIPAGYKKVPVKELFQGMMGDAGMGREDTY